MYVVVTSYYKDSKVDVVTLSSDQEMREYCLKELSKYYNDSVTYLQQTHKLDMDPDKSVQYYVAQLFSSHTLGDMIKVMIIKGEEFIDKERGLTVRYVLKGDEIIEI